MIPQTQQEAPVAPSESLPQWSLATRIGFRFAFSYFLLYLAPGAVGALGLQERVISTPFRDVVVAFWHRVVPWVGTNVLHLQGSFAEVANGSGDELYDYVLILCIVVLAAVVTVAWSLLDRNRKEYRQLYEWLRLFMRLVAGAAMIGYGVKKIFWSQFPPPQLWKLVDTFGQTSPMGLLWTFMGASRFYSLAGGVGEALGGLLLIIPRFTALGALISFGMVSNVLLLNLGYDVPRKIYSIHLLFICVFLLIPEFRRLANVFILNRRAEPVTSVPLFKDKQFSFAAILLQFVFGILVIFLTSREAYLDAAKAATHLPPAIRGIWSVEEFALDGTLRPPLLTDTTRWNRVIFDNPDMLTIQPMDGTFQQYNLKLNPDLRSFALAKPGTVNWNGTFTINQPQWDQVSVRGQVDGHQVIANLHRVDLSDPSQFLLINRGFHWVNDSMHNR
jgi:uncharacterized membrane protein YphA (DoxX/SURF4 family)